MSIDTLSNERPATAAWPSETDRSSAADGGNNPKTAEEYFDEQASDAQRALRQSFEEFTTRLNESADIREWTREFPWIGVGTATAAGFALAAVLVPSPEADNDATVARDCKPAEKSTTEPVTQAEVDAKVGSRSVFWGFVINALFGLARTALTRVLSTSLEQALHGPPRPAPATDSANAEVGD